MESSRVLGEAIAKRQHPASNAKTKCMHSKVPQEIEHRRSPRSRKDPPEPQTTIVDYRRSIPNAPLCTPPPAELCPKFQEGLQKIQASSSSRSVNRLTVSSGRNRHHCRLSNSRGAPPFDTCALLTASRPCVSFRGRDHKQPKDQRDWAAAKWHLRLCGFARLSHITTKHCVVYQPGLAICKVWNWT